MKRTLWLLAFVAPLAQAQISIDKPFARATAPGAKVAAGYMTVYSKGAADRLLGAVSPVSARVELHVMAKDGDIMRMREVKAFTVPANGRLELAPGGSHLMFVELHAPLREGDTVPVTLTFERAGEVRIGLPVGPLGAGGHKGHRH